jgi:hypothetical protein
MDVYQQENLAELILTLIDKVQFNWFQIGSPVAVLIAAIIAAIWAKKSIDSNKSITKKRCTMDYIMTRSRDQKFVNAWSFLRQAHKATNLDIKSFADSNDNQVKIEDIIEIEGSSIDCKQAKDLLSYILNQYEYMATGVHMEIYDEDILINCSKTSTITAFKMTKVYIESLREQSNRELAYIQFEKLVKKWQKIK